MAGDEPGGGGLLAYDAYNVVAVKIAGLTQERLLAVVMVGVVKLEEPVVAAEAPVCQPSTLGGFSKSWPM